MADHIGIDTLSQIFKYLPVRSLLRFRCVCKWAKDIVDSKSFQQEHLSLQKPVLIAQCVDPDEYLVLDPQTLPFFDTHRGPIEGRSFRLVGTLHGVVCLYHNNDSLLIWNPSIRKSSIILLPDVIRDSDFFADDFGFFPYFGFWMDGRCDNKLFKIVAFEVVCNGVDHLIIGALYSSIQQNWTPFRVDSLADRVCSTMREGPPVMIGVVAYWRFIVEWMDDDGEEVHTDMHIISYDFLQERFDITEFPSVSFEEVHDPHLCNLQGSLSLMEWDEGRRGLDVYLNQQGAWVKMFGFNLLHSGIDDVFWMLQGVKERCRVLAAITGALVLYDTADGRIVLKTGLRNSSNILMADGFVQSFIFP